MKTRHSAALTVPAARPALGLKARMGWALGAGALSLAALWTTTPALAQPAPAAPAAAAASAASVAPPPPEARGGRDDHRGHPRHHADRMDGVGVMGMGGRGLMGLGDPRKLDRLLDRINATDAQRTRIGDIAAQAAKDLQGQRDAGRQLHAQMATLLTAKEVDARAVEKLRQQIAAHHDQASRRMTTALVDASKVLTPEQRTQIAQELKKRQERWDPRRKDGRTDRRDGPGPRAGVPQTPSASAAR